MPPRPLAAPMQVPVRLGAPRPRAPRRVLVEQHGCATTEGEARVIEGILEARGHTRAATLDEADAVVLVTCTVVERTERTMLRRIRDLAATGKELVVSGCMAGAQVETIKHAAPAALVLPPAFLHQVGDLLEEKQADFCYAPKAGLPRTREGVLETLVINEGCTGACTFCLTKIARPGLRSYPSRDIITDARRAVEAGAVELRITSQDTAAYGLDSGETLPALLRGLCEIPGDFRIRVGMMNPFALEHVQDELLDAFDHEKVFKFLHLPLQSGSPRILRAMKRGHDATSALAQAAAFRARFPDLLLATDIIAGFPGETDADFHQTLEALDAMQPDIVNITRFSAREGTPAATMDDAVHGPIAKARSRALTSWREKTGAKRFGAHTGREHDVLVTEPGKPGTVLARTDTYHQVALPERPLGTRGRARITGATPHYLTGQWT